MQQIHRRTPMQKCDFNKVVAPFYKNTFNGMLDQINWLVSCFWEPWPTTKLYYVYTYIALNGVLVKRCSNFIEIALLHGLPHDLLYSRPYGNTSLNWVKKGNRISVYDSCSPYNKKHHTKTRSGFWENLKRYYYTIRKSITWKLSVVIYRVFFCTTLKDFAYTNGNSQTVIFILWHHCTKNEVFH